MTECPSEKVFQCVYLAITGDFTQVRSLFHKAIKPDFIYYWEVVLHELLRKRQFSGAFFSIIQILRRYGLSTSLISGFTKVFLSNSKSFMVRRILGRLSQ